VYRHRRGRTRGRLGGAVPGQRGDPAGPRGTRALAGASGRVTDRAGAGRPLAVPVASRCWPPRTREMPGSCLLSSLSLRCCRYRFFTNPVSGLVAGRRFVDGGPGGHAAATAGAGVPKARRAGMSRHSVTVTVNGKPRQGEVEARKLLVHFLRDDLGVTST